MKSFEIKINETKPRETSTWLSQHTVDLIIRNIGVAFPLAYDQDLELPQIGSHDSVAVRAFLFSVKSFVFGTQRGETSQAVVNGFSFQFVSQYALGFCISRAICTDGF